MEELQIQMFYVIEEIKFDLFLDIAIKFGR